MAAANIGEIDFSTFVISLATNAAMQLEPSSKAFSPELAKQTIEILAMLEHKCAGNLTTEESDLVRSLLYQTRLAYCEAIKGGAGSPSAD